MGPPLMDDAWIYGSSIQNIAASIREGRPNGMPSFKGRIPEQQIWQLAAYGRSLPRYVREDVAPGRGDHIQAKPVENGSSGIPGAQGKVGPRTAMPRTGATGPDARDIAACLYTLR